MSKPKLQKYTFGGEQTDVLHLICHLTNSGTGELYVYVDADVDLEWGYNETFEKTLDEPAKQNIRRVANEIALLEPTAHNWPDDLKLAAKRLLGEAVVSACEGDAVGSAEATAQARRFIKAKSKQVSRFWTLRACLCTGGFVALAGLVLLFVKSLIQECLGELPLLLAMCFCAGCVGAVLFVVLKFGKQPNVDSTAERHLHYLEGVARIVGGGIAGTLVGGMVKLGLILPIFEQTRTENLAMCAAAMIAGASERLAAGIITKVENNEMNKKEEGE